MNILNGYKTYIAAAGFMLVAVADWVGGNTHQAWLDFMTGLGFIGVRAKLEEAIGSK